MNELKTFLEEDRKILLSDYYSPLKSYNSIENHDQRLIQKVVEMVKKEVDKEFEGEHDHAQVITKKDIHRLLNNLTT